MNEKIPLPTEHLCLFVPTPQRVNLQDEKFKCPLIQINPDSRCQCRLMLNSTAAARAAHIDPQQNYLVQCALAEGHSAYGTVASRKSPYDPSKTMAEEAGMGFKSHPLLGKQAQFSGEFEPDSVLPDENPTTQEELEYRLSLALGQQPSYTHTPKLER